MALNIKVKLISNESNKAMRNTSIKLNFYLANGRPRSVATAKTNAAGNASMSTNIALGSHLPRVVLQALVNRKWVNLTGIPKSYSSSTLNFGTVRVNTVKPVMIANMAFVGMAAAVASPTVSTAGASAVNANLLREKNELGSRLKISENQRLTLDTQFKKSQVEKTQKDTELKALQLKLTTANNKIIGLEARPSIATIGTPTATSANFATKALKSDAVFSGAVSAIEKADSRLKAKGRFRIESAKLDLKVLSGGSADEVRLVKDGASFAALNPGLLSSILVNLATDSDDKTSDSNSVPPVQKMPSLISYTRTMAERKLDEIGQHAMFYPQQLSLDQVKKNPSMVGQVIQQFPKQGTQIIPETEIMLLVGQYLED